MKIEKTTVTKVVMKLTEVELNHIGYCVYNFADKSNLGTGLEIRRQFLKGIDSQWYVDFLANNEISEKE